MLSTKKAIKHQEALAAKAAATAEDAGQASLGGTTYDVTLADEEVLTSSAGRHLQICAMKVPFTW